MDFDLSAFENLYLNLLDKTIGEDITREGLKDTPKRAAKAWYQLTTGYQASFRDVFRDFDSGGHRGMIVMKDIEFFSLCEHHLLPFFGVAHVGYIPESRIVGLSKLARVVDIYARRLQVQERMTDQIADTLEEYLKPKGTAVVISAKHMCMAMRGVQKFDAETTTSALRGVIFDEDSARQEFMDFVNRGR